MPANPSIVLDSADMSPNQLAFIATLELPYVT